jgi:hypothetical protein
MQTLIAIQDTLVLDVNCAIAKWAHRPGSAWSYGGHADRSIRAAKRKARARLERLGMSPSEVEYAVKQALDVAELERISEGN